MIRILLVIALAGTAGWLIEPNTWELWVGGYTAIAAGVAIGAGRD